MPTHLSRRTFVAATGAALATTTVGLSASSAAEAGPSRPPKPTVVLVHGGFADASASWNGVIARLQDRGYPVIAPANPLRNLPYDAAYVASVLASINGPVVLAGHSYGGAVITNAAASAPNVKALVYIAAFVPDVGEALGELIAKYPGSEIEAALNPVPYPNPDGSTGTDLYLQADQLRRVFAADLPTATTRLLVATQRPFSAQCFADLTQAAAWRTIPSWGLVATQDLAIPPALQRFEYQRANARGTVSVAASHCAMVSHPELTADLIERAANNIN
ncbi:alpha/beta hydrolase [Micromonospora sp. DPT]|uniref:alpha/beta fold hydrolase n=1 Tax=Micromonospora sp. DPT TaxID=3142975 RepID=UPI00320A8B70